MNRSVDRLPSLITESERKIFSMEKVRDNTEALLVELKRLPQIPEVKRVVLLMSKALEDAEQAVANQMRSR